MGFRRREDIQVSHAAGLAQQAQRGIGPLVFAVLILAAVALLLGISIRFRREWDFSSSRENVLSPQTLSAIGALREDVRLCALFTPKNPQRENFFYLLEQYRQASSRVKIEFVDPVARPGVVKDLGINVQEEGRRRDGITVAVRGPSRLVFRGVEEEDVTNALLEVGSDRKRVVGFLRGFGEHDPASTGDEGYSTAVEALLQEYYEVRDVSLAEGIPPGVSVVVAAGPSMPVPPADLDRLAGWLERGGRMLALLDLGSGSGIEKILEPWGLRPSGKQIIDPRDNVNGRAEFLKVTKYRSNESNTIARGFGKNLPTGFPLAQGVEHFEPGDQEVFHDSVALAGEYSISLASDGARGQGPFAVAAASWKRWRGRRLDTETRVVLVGDADFAGNLYLAYGANKNFFLNCVGWLSRGEGLVSIRRKPLEGQELELNGRDRLISVAAIFAPPVFLGLAGVLVFLRRRGL